MTSCSHCGGELPADASFCPACGRRTDAVPVAREVPIEVQHAETRWFGLGPPAFVFGVALALVALAIVLAADGNLLLALVVLLLALALVPSLLAGARRWPGTRLARASLGAADRARDEASAAAGALGTLSRAGRDTLRLRREQLVLSRRRDALIRELGASVYADDGRAEELKAAARELDEQVGRNERELARTIAGARRSVRRERAAVATTEIVEPDESAKS